MKYFDWNREKNELLKSERGISFEEVVDAIVGGRVLGKEDHSNKKKYPNQKIYILEIGEYVYLVPFVEDDEKIFLKTIIPSRKATKKYLVKK
ncbi:BrnT family toxin [Candidatus Woesebacteria bacterium]|nr:BrnT family toxin [Candidatus Woesebacteria bacterium]